MNLPLEVAKTLHVNEAARLLCHHWCPAAKTCTGAEAHSLKELQLLEATGSGLDLTHLGTGVAKENRSSLCALPVPKLIG